MPKPPPIRVAVVVSRYNATVTDKLLEGAKAAFAEWGGGQPQGNLSVFSAPGAFELPAIASAALSGDRFDGVVALGCIIKGETIHDRVLADAVTGALCEMSMTAPIGLGVLTVDTPEQAIARAGGELGNKGAEAMTAVLATIAECRRAAAESLAEDNDSRHAYEDGGPSRAAHLVAPRPDKLVAKNSHGKGGRR